MDCATYSYYDGQKGVNIPSCIFKSLDVGVVIVGFFSCGIIGESIVTKCEFYELYGVAWVKGDGCMAICGGF